MRFGFEPQRVLDFDIEVRPLGWYGGDWVHKEVTAIGWAWIIDGEPAHPEVYYLDRTKRSSKRMLQAFKAAYIQADMVVGHYIRGFDLPNLNWAYAEHDMPLLGPKLTHDTKGDLVKMQGLSKSQENVASFLGIESPKVGMNMAAWRAANRLTDEGFELAVERVLGDVIQNIEMREALLKRELLGRPRMWYPDGSGATQSYSA
jgi:hypothetical protein